MGYMCFGRKLNSLVRVYHLVEQSTAVNNYPCAFDDLYFAGLKVSIIQYGQWYADKRMVYTKDD